MIRVILGVIVGFVVWTILWVGSHLLLVALLPNWYGKIDADFQEAVSKGAAFTVDSTVLIFSLARSIFITIISAYAAVLISRENAKTPLVLGVLLLLVGLLTQISYWNYMPLWYHIPFLLLLIPMAVWGGKLKKI